MKIQNINEKELIEDYLNFGGVEQLAYKYHIGKKRVKSILKDNGIEIRSGHFPRVSQGFVVADYHVKKYVEEPGFHFEARSKDGCFTTNDFDNQAGILTNYIKTQYNIEIPTLYERRKYYQTTGNYWWEQWFDIIKCENKSTKTCPICGWTTIDISNKTGAFETHIKKEHGLTVEEYLNLYPQDIDFFSVYKKKKEKEETKMKTGNHIYCPICGKPFEKLTHSHIQTHGLSMEEFRKKYPDTPLLSENMNKQVHEAVKLGNLTVSKKRFVSKYEIEIRAFLDNNNIKYNTNRQLLIGREIDILIESAKLGIEFNGLKWHTEWFGGKEHNYHLKKTLDCNKKGYGLIHIFEDEYVNHKDIVFSKLKHYLKLDSNQPKIMGRKCEIRTIYMDDAKEFLNKYHIQGFVSGTIYLGAFYNENLVAVMVFKKGNIKNPDWELVRCAADTNYRFQGVTSKMFTHFVREYKPSKIVSFADRRWTISKDNNLYTNLGFILEKCTNPDYKYYKDDSKNGQKYERIHKMFFNKKKLCQKYGFPSTMTETEMAKELGYDRIWDCGLFKYVWTPENM